MAEAAGLAIGVVALAGTLNDCIDLFAYISASRNLERDFELLDTRLDVEKTLLLQWSARVRLLEEDYDDRLDEPNVLVAISRVLSSIQHLLSDSQSLQNRYGMRSEAQHGTTNNVSTVSGSALTGLRSTLSAPRMTRFMTNFSALSIRSEEPRGKVPTRNRVRWVIHDKEKFEGLIQQLSYFISKLNEIVPDVNGALVSMTRDDLSMLRVSRLRMVLEASAGREALMANSAEHAIEKSCTRRILDCFWYRAMDDRRSGLASAHASTLKWALEPPSEEVASDWDDLSHWLEHGTGIYWVSGKAGSGKSTLMKHLYEHDKTQQLLHRWASPAPLTMADFFFYALGTDEQKSQQGLVRALLYQVLRAEESLIPTLFPSMWQEAQISDEVDLKLPSQGETKEAFEAIRNGLKMRRKFSFFIDGLDEYSGDYIDAISIIKSLVTNPDIKILVSSRPIPSCVQAFSTKPRLQLQDLTKEDIVGYIHDTISSDPYIEQLAVAEPDLATGILDELVNKASGVFLWVVLACRSLRAGFAAFDNASELRQRIDELPRELEDLFKYMLGKIETRYQVQAAKLLRICHQNQLSGGETLPSIGLAIVDGLGMDPRKVELPGRLHDTAKRAKCEALEGRLRSRCCGLLEVSRVRDASATHHCFCNVTTWVDSHDELIDSKVSFIHRTVFDFLSQAGVWDLECLQVHDSFDVNALLSCIYLQLLALTAEHKFRGQGGGEFFLKQAMVHAACADSSAPAIIVPVLLRLEVFLQTILQQNPSFLPFMNQPWLSSSDLLDFFKGGLPFALILAVESGMVNFVRSRAGYVRFPENLSHTLLLHAIRLPCVSSLSRWQVGISAEMVRYLLSSGSDPNAVFSERRKRHTPWRCLLGDMERHRFESSIEAADIVEAFIQAGADVNLSEAETGDGLVASIKRNFVDCHDAIQMPPDEKWSLRKKGLEILRIIEDRRASTVGDSVPSVQSHLTSSRFSCERQSEVKRSKEEQSEGPVKRRRIIDLD